MMRASKYSAEVRERAVRLVREQTSEYESRWTAIRSIAEKVGCSGEALRKWVRQAEQDAGHRPGLSTEERQCGFHAMSDGYFTRSRRFRASAPHHAHRQLTRRLNTPSPEVTPAD